MDKFKSYLLKHWFLSALVLLSTLVAMLLLAHFTSKAYIIQKSIEPSYMPNSSPYDKIKMGLFFGHPIADIIKSLFKPEIVKPLDSFYDANSLSYFIFTSAPITIKGIPLDYDVEPDFNFNGMLEYLEKHRTLVAMKEVRNIRWKNDGDTFSGSFNISTNYGFKARCLFQGEFGKITKMVFARKGSDKFEDGYAVFGCDYGKYALSGHINTLISNKINLPYCDNAEVITIKDPRSINIDIDKKGNISIARMFISVELLISILKKCIAEYGKDVPVFLFVDEMADDKIEVVVTKIKGLGIEPYRVYFDSKNKGRFVCVAKKL